MSVNLDTADLEGTPRFQQSPGQARRLVVFSHGALLLAGLLWLLAMLVGLFAPAAHWSVLLSVNAATLLLLGAVGQSAWVPASWRAEALGVRPAQLAFWRVASAADEQAPLSALERGVARIGEALRRQLQRVGYPALRLFALAALALALLSGGWQLDLPAPVAVGQAGWLSMTLLAALAFGLLVVERHLAAVGAVHWPEADALAAVLRLVLVVQVLTLVCLVSADGQRLWPARLAVLMALLPGLLALELMLRAVLATFQPRRPQEEPALVARSLVAGLMQWPPRPLAFLQGEVQQRFGIDLRQVWAFGFMRRALLPVAGLVAVGGWLLSGVVQVPLDGRGVYERFGAPVQVYPPGLHVGLPWPLGRVVAVDNGTLRTLATAGDASQVEPPGDAEGAAPASANRLWDATHVAENAQVIAGSEGNGQSVQIVNMDVRFIYRIGLDDASALAATYHSSDIAQLVRSTANRVLVHDFAKRSLDELLGAQREALGRDIGRAVQADLDRLDSGVQILATAVEAIHPPAGAANAYHGVQAAQISAQALVARDRGQAAQQASLTRQNAAALSDKASAAAHENTARAQAAKLTFDAERSAWQQAGQAFILEQYLARLNQGLAGGNLLIIDHRLGAAQAPTLDLRSFAAPADPVSTRPQQERSH
ncbi:protease modulator HflK [Pantoea sp. Cy-639]|uniref:protease modulator HflK n=1 Tax=Pantoea sp. Cy-639 TaxID=2608360 RepID=UPI0014243E15|nr:protease modulator HflK [Pantoea sp. Cy-639]NIF18176.1 protease modulator HflK [Pantoea sp. Cy-639]